MSVTPPRIAKFPQSPTIQWSDGTNFNGFCLIGYIPPTDGVTSYTQTDYGKQSPAEILPTFAVIPIVDGLYNASLGLFWNADISPPNSTYNARYYDTTKRLIAGPSVAFSVTSDPISTIPAATLTVPIAGGTAPTPDS